MKPRPWICYTETNKALMWDRWQKGGSLHQITPLFDRHCPSIQGILAQRGGQDLILVSLSLAALRFPFMRAVTAGTHSHRAYATSGHTLGLSWSRPMRKSLPT